MTIRLKPAASALATLLAALPLTAAAAEELPIPAELPAAVKALFDREAPKLAAKGWKLGDRLEGQVEASAAPEVKLGEEMDEVSFAIGTDATVDCTVSRERLDAGGWIAGVVGEIGKNVKVVAARPVDLSVVNGSALLFVDLLYLAETPEGKKVGLVKTAVYAHDARMFLCVHDEPGYRKSFRRIVGGFAQAMKGGEDERDGARFTEIASAYIGTVPVGFSETAYWDRKGGGTVARSRMSMLLPRTPSDLMGMDSYKEEESDAKELVVSGLYVEAAAGELSHRISLTRSADGKRFAVEGSKAGKDLKGGFDAKDGLASDVWFSRRLAAGAKATGVVSHATYSASDDPLKTRVMTAKVVKGPVRKVEISSGKLTYVADLDDDGQQVRAELPLGPITLKVERVWSRGKP